jgi:low temperature requirement protein LtrA
VIGAVDGLSGAERDAKTIITGMLALSMGFGFWWIYFDLVGRRLPRAERLALANWVMSHLPITLAITAAGAGMVSLIGHAHDASTPAGTSWLLAGALPRACSPWSSPSRRWPTPNACPWCSTPYVWRCPQGRRRP